MSWRRCMTGWLAVAGFTAQALVPFGAPLRAEPPRILSPYKSMFAPGGRMRTGAHPAIDFDGRIGDPVLAAADGTVVYAAESTLCGNGIWLRHDAFGLYTLYCQLEKIHVRLGDAVTRGQVIAALGVSGEPTLRAVHPREPIPMLHFGLGTARMARFDGELENTLDPMSMTVGCFDAAKTYSADRLVLTYPLRCKD